MNFYSRHDNYTVAAVVVVIFIGRIRIRIRICNSNSRRVTESDGQFGSKGNGLIRWREN